MLLNLDNEIDKKLSQLYPEHVINDMKKETMSFFGVNITEDPEEDFKLKIYFERDSSYNLYKDSGKSEVIIDYLQEKKMVRNLEAVYDEKSIQFDRYDIRLKNRNRENMLDFFELLDKNTKFFSKYKDEVMKLSKSIICSTNPKNEYSSLFFFGVKKVGSDVDTLKFYWLKDSDFKQQCFDALNSCGIPQIQKLVPIALKAEKICGENILMVGIDYQENSPRKHKIYIEYPTNTYDGLVATFSDNQELINKINLVRKWHEIHPEFICDGFNIGINAENQLLISFYFIFKTEEEEE